MTWNKLSSIEDFMNIYYDKKDPYPRDLDTIAAYEKRDDHLVKYPHRICINAGYWSLEIMENWCRDHFGDMDGPCDWDDCPLGYSYWYHHSGLEKQLEDELDAIYANHSDQDERQILSKAASSKHFRMLKTRNDCTAVKHGHDGVWRAEWIVKSGYEIGYQDFLFKNKADAVEFKLHWGDKI